ncbi:glycosyl hydrolase [Streptomyces sp. NPDC004376]
MNDDLDFHLGELAPADADSEEALETLWPGDLTVLSQHHTTPHGSHSSYVLAHDRSATWRIPGAPQLVAIAVARDLNLSTFTLETSYHATASFAQNWLAARGCPPKHITTAADGRLKPNDDLTLQVEQQIQESGTRYEVLDSYTSESDPCETWTLAHDAHATQAPVRVFHEQWDHEAGTYTMREGAFADTDAAHSWLDDRDGPLPEPPEYSDPTGAAVRARTARIALARSADAAAMQKAIRDVPCTPPPGPVQRPVQGRPL